MPKVLPPQLSSLAVRITVRSVIRRITLLTVDSCVRLRLHGYEAKVMHESSLVPGAREKRRSAWYTLFAHAFKVAQYPGFLSLTNLEIHAGRLFAFLIC